MEQRVYAIKTDNGDWVLSVLGVPFGGPFNGKDRDGEYFDARSNIHQDKFPEIPAVYMHGLDPATGKPVETPQYIGKARYDHTDERGHWYRAVLNKTSEFARRVWEAALKGMAAVSSGAIHHLVRRGENGHLVEWPTVEMTFTDGSGNLRPANPYAVAMPALKALYSEAGIQFDVPDPEGGEPDQKQNNNATEGSTKMEETKKEETPVEEPKKEAAKASPDSTLDIMQSVIDAKNAENQEKARKAAEAEAMKAKMGELVDLAMQSAPAVNGGGSANINLKTRRGDSHAKAFEYYIRTGDKGALKTDYYLNDAVDEEGQATAPKDFYNQIIQLLALQSFPRAAGARSIVTSNRAVDIPVQKVQWAAPGVTTQSQTSTATAATQNTVQPFDTLTVTPLKYTMEIRLSDEYVTDDKANVMSMIAETLAGQFAVLENALCVTELAAGVTAHKTAAAAAAIAAGDITGLYYTVAQPYRNNSVWVVEGSTEGAIHSIQGDPFTFVGTPQGLSGGVGIERLMGKPIFNADTVSAIGASNKSAWFGNFNYMGMVTNGSLSFKRLNEVYAPYGQIAILASLRIAFKTLNPAAFAYLVHPAS
jgi:HK97 family phage major capsid protein